MNAKVADGTADWLVALNGYCDSMNDQWVATRRHLHQHPEISEAEYQTTEYLLAVLGKLDLPTHVPGEGRGVTADFISSPKIASGKRIAIRGDIDALPIQDGKSVSYRSTCDGVMHACGHDVHAAIVVGAMQLLTTMHGDGKLPWPIAVRAILQPSEELATGAKHMIHHHALRDIDSILGLHVDPTPEAVDEPLTVVLVELIGQIVTHAVVAPHVIGPADETLPGGATARERKSQPSC